MRSPLARERHRPAGFILPCQPTLSDTVPSGPLWLHEIKHDGYRIMARAATRARPWAIFRRSFTPLLDAQVRKK